MAREFHCSDTGMQCDYIAKGDTDDEVMDNAARHVMSKHPEAVSTMSDQDRTKLMENARSAIHDSSIHDQH